MTTAAQPMPQQPPVMTSTTAGLPTMPVQPIATPATQLAPATSAPMQTVPPPAAANVGQYQSGTVTPVGNMNGQLDPAQLQAQLQVQQQAQQQLQAQQAQLQAQVQLQQQQQAQ